MGQTVINSLKANTEVVSLLNRYRDEYKVTFSVERMLDVLLEARVLKSHQEDVLVFPYKYYYYYFAARFMASNLNTARHGQAIRSHIEEMVGKVYDEDNANILIFLVYLTRDEALIAGILANAKGIYAEYEPCDLDAHISFVKNLTGKKPLTLPLDRRVPDAQEEHRELMDETAFMEKEHLEFVRSGDHTGDDGMKDVEEALRIKVAFKTLEIMGQILRNFPGMLAGDMKVEIAHECYLLGLRTLRAVHRIMADNLDVFRAYFGEMFRELGSVK